MRNLEAALGCCDVGPSCSCLRGILPDDYYVDSVPYYDRLVKDLDLAIEAQTQGKLPQSDEWRIHFHVPLHASPGEDLGDTRLHVIDTLFWLNQNPDTCKHLEMETYTWEVLPKELQAGSVIEQVGKEYRWTLNQMEKIGFSIEGN